MSVVRTLTLVTLLISIGFFLGEAAADDPEYEFRFDDPSDGTGDIDLKSTLKLKVEIENLITDPKKFRLDITNNDDLLSNGLKAWWSHDGQTALASTSQQLAEVQVGNLSTIEGITVTIEATENALYGAYEVDLRCRDKDDSDPDVTDQLISLTINVNEIANVSLVIYEGGSSEGSADVRGETTYRIQINNDGNRDDTFSLSLSPSEWDTSFSENSVTVSAFSSQTVDLNINTSSDSTATYGDSEDLTVTATSGNNDGRTATLSLTTHIRVYGGLGLAPVSESISGEPGDTVIFNFKILNKWSDSVNFEITKKDWYRGTPGNPPDQGWSFSEGTGTLDAFQEVTTSSSTSFKVTISSSASAGEVLTIIVRATSVDDEISTELEIEVKVEGEYNIQLVLPQSDQINLLPRVQKSLSNYVQLVNHAKVNDLVTISVQWVSGGEDWTYDVPAPISIAASGVKPLFISVTAPDSAAGGQATLKIRVESGGDSTVYDETTMTFRVDTVAASSGPETDQLSEKNNFPVNPLLLVSIVLIIGLGSAAVFGLQQKSKGAFGGSDQSEDDFSDEWAGMEGAAGAAVPQMAPPQPVAPPPAEPPQPAAAPPPQPQAPPSTAAIPETAPPPPPPPPQPEAPPPAAAPAAPMILTVTVPDGVMAGQQIQIKAPTGQLVNVKVPEGCGPGSQFKIQI
jgi:hypothetical protein